jgi:membrane protein required for colicin V production
MDPDFNPFDWLLVAVLAYSTIRAFLRGILLEIFSLVGLIAGILIASWYYQALEVPLGRVLGKLFKTPATVCTIGSFLCIALGVMLLCALAARLIRRSAKAIGLGFFDRLLGAVFGFARGCLIGVALLMAITAFLPHSAWISQSRLSPYFLDAVHAVSFVVPRPLQQKLLNGIADLKHTAPNWIKLRQ